MASIDIFNDNAFSMTSLSDALEIAPYQPQLLGRLGVFQEKSIYTTTAFIEKRNQRLHLLSTAARGSMKDVRVADKRKAYPIQVPHIPYFQNILADDIQNVRAFGSETEVQVMSSYVNDQLEGMRTDHEVTMEYHRVGALKGAVLDSDGTTEIANLFDIFDLTQTEINVAGTDNLTAKLTTIIRTIAGNLGASTMNKIVCLCGNNYFDGISQHETTLAAYDRWRDGEYKRMSYLGDEWYSAAANGFEFQNILFINYRGSIDDIEFIDSDEGYYFPLGVRGLFQEIMAPADFMETVNTRGKRLYAKQEPLPMNKGVQLHTQSNVLAVCTRPDIVVKSTYSSGSSS